MAVRMRIGEVARQRGLTIKALAQRAGVAYNTAHALYTGRATRIDLETLERICGALQVEPGELFIRHVPPEAAERAYDYGGSYGTDSDRPARPRDRRTSGPL